MAAQTIIEVLINARNNASGALKEVSSQFGDVQSNMLKAGTGAAAVGVATVALTKGFIEQAGAMEQNQVAFTTMLGSADKANALLKEMSAFAAKTPFNLQDVVTAGKQLLAYGFQQKDVIKNTEMLGNVAAGLGIPLGDLVYLYGTLQVQQRAYTKDLVQFTNRGIDVMTPLAAQFGVAKDKVYELASQGKISFKDVEKAFQGMTGEGGKFYNLMDKQSKTTLGTWSNLQDSITRLQIAMGNALLPAVNSLMASIMPMLQAMTEWAKQNPEIVKGIIIVGLVIGALGAAMLAIVAIVTPVVALFALIGPAVAGATIAFGALAAVFAFLISPIGLVILAVVAVVAIMALLYKAWTSNWGDIQGKTQAVIKGLISGFQAVVTWFKSVGEAFASFGKYIMAVVDDGDYANDWLSHLPDFIQPVVMWIGHAIQIFKGLGAVIIDFFTGGDVTATWYEYFRTTFMGIAIFIDNFQNAIIALPEVLANIGTAIINFFVGLPAMVQGALQAFGDAIYNFFVVQIPFAVGYMSAIIEIFFTQTIPAAWTALVTFFTVAVPTFTAQFILWIADMVLQAGLALFNWATVTVPATIQAMIDWLAVAIPAMVTAVTNWFVQLGINVWQTILKMKDNVIAGVTAFINGTIALIIQMYNTVVNWIVALYNAVIKWFQTTVTDATSAINELPGNISAAMEAVKNAAVSKAQDIYNGVKGWFDKIVGFFNDIIGKAGAAMDAANKAFSAGRSAGGKQGGGIVPGPIGAGRMVYAHGGEEVVPVGLSGRGGVGGGVTLNVSIGLYAGSETEKRNVAADLYAALVQVALSQNKTVKELMGG